MMTKVDGTPTVEGWINILGKLFSDGRLGGLTCGIVRLLRYIGCLPVSPKLGLGLAFRRIGFRRNGFRLIGLRRIGTEPYIGGSKNRNPRNLPNFTKSNVYYQ